MRIDKLDVYHVAMPLIYPWRTAYGEDPEIHSVLVKAISGEHTAWSESSPLYAPMYLPESAADAPERRVIEPPQSPLADAEPVFHIDDEHGALVLDIRHHDGENIGIDQITVDTLTPRDAEGPIKIFSADLALFGS